MQQLSGLDNSFLNMETATTFGHVSSLTRYDGSAYSAGEAYSAIRSHVESRVSLLPPFRRRLVEVPFGIDLPYWIDDADFDLDFHVRHIAVPPPGEDPQLADLVGRIIGRPLDRARPLWELYVIEGLANGDVAILLKIHHAAIDGQASMELWKTMLDPSPIARHLDAPEVRAAEPVPHPFELLARSYQSMMRQPARLLRVQQNAFRAMGELFLGGAASPLFPVSGLDPEAEAQRVAGIHGSAAPETPFNRTLTSHRRVAWCDVALSDIKAIKRSFGTTVNDVVMAICGGALRRYLRRADALPDAPLVAMVPVSMRTGDETDTYTNRVSGVLAEIATDEADPAERLRRTSRAMASAKEMHRAIPADLLQDFAHFATPAVAAQASRMAAGLGLADQMTLPFNLVISNVPGPREPLYNAGAELKAMIPISAVGEGMGLNITVVSYRDRLDFGLVACRELVPDLWAMTEDLVVALEELKRVADTRDTLH